VVVEDSPAGAAAAAGAGMRSILYAPSQPIAVHRSGGVIRMTSMDQLPGLIAAL
jgi:beta-phosphoglucomutase-like phosphatase (HAD superfamily)